jgi:Rrf2 family protein
LAVKTPRLGFFEEFRPSIPRKNPKQDTVGNGAFIERSPLKPLNYILLELPSKVEYALLALMEMAGQADGKIPITVNEITAKHPIPERYLEQILANLRRGGLLKSQRGAKGGYILAKAPEEITILDVVTAIEGDREAPSLSDDTTIEMKLIRETWQKANLSAQAILGQHTLKSLCSEREAYLQKGLMYYI